MRKSENHTLPVWMVCVLVTILGLPVCFCLLQNHMIKGHDAVSNLMMACYMDKYAGDGQFLVRWASNLNFGYGYPMFNFYPPGYFFLTFFVSRITHDVVLSMNLIASFFWVLSGLGMYFFSREFWGEKGGLLSAVAYMYAPYHIQDIYVRSAFSEFSAFAFFPLILISFYKISVDFRRRYILLGVFSVFALGCGHTIMLMLFAPVAVSYLLLLFFLKRNFCGLLTGFGVLGTGILMSAFYWLPAFCEKKFLTVSFLVSLRNDFHRNFVSWPQLLHLPWGKTADSDGISFQIGLIHLILALIPLVYMSKLLKQKNNVALHYFFFWAVAAVTVFFLLPPSQILWEHLSILKFVQLPWRFLVIVSFVISLLTGSLMIMFKGKAANFVLVAALGLIIFSSVKFFWPVTSINIDQVDVKNKISGILYLGEGISTPQWVKTPPLAPPLHKFEFLVGRGEIEDDKAVSAIEHVARVHAQELSFIIFHSFYFPGWQVFIDGKETQIFPDNPYGRIMFFVLPGEHTVKVAFGSTPVRTIAWVISWTGLALLAAAMLGGRNFKESYASF